MGVSVILIFVMVSKKIKYSQIESNEITRKLESSEPILIDEYCELDDDHNYHDFKEYKNLKYGNRESNYYSLSTGGNSINNNVYPLSQKNGFEYKKIVENDIEEFINDENEFNRIVYDKGSNKGTKMYHKKDQFMII